MGASTGTIFEIDLRFQAYEPEKHGSLKGIYIRSLVEFAEAIDYIGTAGERPGRTFADRFKDRARHYRNSQATYLRIKTGEVLNSVEGYLLHWRKVAAGGFDPSLIFIPGMPSRYPPDKDESPSITSKMARVFVAPLEDYTVDSLAAAFGSRSRGLRAVEARVQTMVRSFYAHKLQDENFPFRVKIDGENGDSSTKSLMLGDTKAVDLENSDRVRIRSFSCDGIGGIWNELAKFIEDVQFGNLRRSTKNNLIYGLR